MSALVQELRAIAAHLFDRVEQTASAPDPSILEAVAAECEGAARVLRRTAAELRREEKLV